MKSFLKATLFSVLLGCAAFIVMSNLPSGTVTTIKNLPVKADHFIGGTITGTYASTEKELPALADSLEKVDTLLVAYKSKYRMQLYYSGKLIKTYIIGLGQEPVGHKQQQGDNRTPEGNYRIIQKTVGPFDGSNPYLGNRWMRLNYPNNADAKAGLEKKLITQSEYNKIVAANKAGTEPLKTTKLGGGIGIHGWYGSWPGDDEQDLTWGCITMQNSEVEDLYGRVKLQTRIVIYP
jgi:hypothetical protein